MPAATQLADFLEREAALWAEAAAAVRRGGTGAGAAAPEPSEPLFVYEDEHGVSRPLL